MFVAVCSKCKKKVAVPRPGSVAGTDNIKGECPFCSAAVYSKKGFEVTEPPAEQEEFDLLSVG
ncbi:unnamed protein product [marine sediment metagenome]|uniref:DUF5679 domain-containing protein n=1 Tax=marine sediment metagenome TaxID=412755 RepID=X0WNL4_9ZZZZ